MYCEFCGDEVALDDMGILFSVYGDKYSGWQCRKSGALFHIVRGNDD